MNAYIQTFDPALETSPLKVSIQFSNASPLETLRNPEPSPSLQVCTACPSTQPILSLLNNPSLNLLCPIRHRILVQCHMNILVLSRPEVVNLGECFQLKRRVREPRGRRQADVELHDFRTRHVAGIRNSDRCGQSERVVGDHGFRYPKVGKREFGVGQAETVNGERRSSSFRTNRRKRT